MKYMLLIYDPADGYAGADGLSLLEQVIAAHGALAAELQHAGILVDGAGLQGPETATTVLRGRGGKATVLDGPFAETKEILGGYYVIDAPDRDAALAIARRMPGAEGTKVEVRPLMIED